MGGPGAEGFLLGGCGRPWGQRRGGLAEGVGRLGWAGPRPRGLQGRGGLKAAACGGRKGEVLLAEAGVDGEDSWAQVR